MRVQFCYIFLICIFNIAISSTQNIQNSTCDQHTQFTCDDRSCISIQEKCNGKHDCKDGSDENNCINNCKAPFWFKCHNDQCITADLVCDGEYDCLDLSDERNCSHLAKKSCTANQFVCHDGLCISNLWKCNGIEECLLGEDEKSCTSMYCKDNIKCESGECMNENWKCDGVFDCRDDSDEKDCGSKTKPEFCTSDRGLVLCADKTHCIPHEEVCNGVSNCPDHSDELFCSASHNCVETHLEKSNRTVCTCPRGYHLNTGGGCKDIDECTQYGICDQQCSNIKGHYNCSCADGYNLQKDGRTCEVSEGDVMLFYSDNISIRRLSIKSKTTSLMVKNLFNVKALAFYDNRIYYSELIEDDYRISSADESGSKKKNLITIGLGEPAVIAIDYITTNLYFTDTKFQHIAVCTLDGIHCKVLLIFNNEKPQGLALHPVRGEMFWSEWGTTPRIAHASMDGNNDENFITDNLGSPVGIAVDVYDSRLFWVDSQKKLIESVKLDGTDRRVIFKANLIHPFSLRVFENRVYWSDLTTHTVESCNKFNGKNHNTLVKHAGETLSNIEVYHPLMHENHPNPCKNSSCSELCLLAYRGSYSCQCSVGKKVDSNTTRCINVTNAQKFVLGTINSLWMMEYTELGRLNVTKLPIVVENITAVAYNMKSDTMLIADEITKSIKKLNLQNYKVDIIITNVDHITALDYDYLGNNIYWCDSERGNVEVYNLETKARRIITTLPAGQKPTSMALVPEFGYIFLAVQRFRGNAEVDFLYMDGSNSIKILRDTLVGPVYLAYDPFLKNIFWADSSIGNIESYHIIDKQKKVFRGSQASVRGILVSQNNVFWIKQKSNKLFWSDRSHDLGPHRNNHFTIDEINHNEDITHFISISPRPFSTHACEKHNGNCSHICVPGENMSAKCLCPNNMNLTSDGKSCGHVLTCQNDEFKCNKSEICIPMSSRCNHKNDCIFGEDESDCRPAVACPTGFFQCHNEDCIEEYLVCDMNYDCRDKSDELHCDNIIKSKCSRTEFMCSDKKCIPNTSLCNNVTDCSGAEDELNCSSEKCKKGYYRCPIGGCIPNAWICDDEPDCVDGSDEHENCVYTNCEFPDFRCDTGLCIDGDLICNGVNDCGDFSDETTCKENYTNFCKPNEFSCHKSKSVCLPNAVRCNETFECPNYEDEEGCTRCPLGEYMCSNEKCIPSVYVCDGYDDCNDNSDESYMFCSHLKPNEKPLNESNSCENKFTCIDDGHCIDHHLVCNHEYNCKDGSDEGELCNFPCDNACTSCRKTPQGPKCVCPEGFRLSGDHNTCVDIEECKREPPVCSQMCEELQGSFKCTCHTNFKLRYDQISCKSIEQNVIFTIMSNNAIFAIGSNRKLEEVYVANSVLRITDFDISVPSNLLYFIAEDDGELHRIDLKTKEHSYMFGLGRPQLIAVEWISENVYYVNENITNRLIHVCNFETRYCSVIDSIFGDINIITGLTIDAVNKYIFYAVVEKEDSWISSKIYKCNLDGSYIEEIHMSYGNYVTGMTFDFYKKLLYFVDQRDELVFKITYHGTDQMTIVQNFPNSSKLNIYENHLYFLNSKHELIICPLFGNYFACIKTILHDIEIEKFVMNHPTIQPLTNRSKCQTSKCNKLCVPIEDDVRCLCETESDSDRQGCVRYELSNYSEKVARINAKRSISIWIWICVCLIAGIVVGFAVYFYYPEKTRLVVYQSVRYVSQRGRKENDAELLIGD